MTRRLYTASLFNSPSRSLHSQCQYTAYIGEKEFFGFLVVREVEKNFSARFWFLRAWTSFAAPRWIWPFSSSGHDGSPSGSRSYCQMSYRNINAHSSSWPDFSPPCL